jgi:nicotinate-nucleotide pyrophosphorylase (carboxylating)
VAVKEAVARALAEDLLPLGDLTASLVPESFTGRAALVVRSEGVVAGRLCAIEAFAQVAPGLIVDWHLPDGSKVLPGDVVAEVSGQMRALLTAERTVLNFLCHLSGVATMARRYVEAVSTANPATRVLDTRKTTPGLRALEKAAVRAGGAQNHRGSLSEAVLVKDNHLGGLSMSEVATLTHGRWPGRPVEIECDRAEQVAEALSAGASAVLLDNMTPDEVARCVSLVHECTEPGTVLVEVSGGVSLETAPAYARAGADLISVGAITHSAPALDIGLDVIGFGGDGARPVLGGP